MQNNNTFIKQLLLLVLFLTFVIFISNKLISNRENTLLNDLYNSNSKHLKEKINTLITDKKNTNTAIAVSISKDYALVELLESKRPNKINLNNLSLDLRKNTNYKNVWIEVFDKESKLLYQSWKDKTDVLISSKNYFEIIEEVNVNQYDLSFITTVPVYKNKDYLGFIKVSTKFNSITKLLKQDGIESIILVNQNESKKISKPFTNIFYKDFYVANIDANTDLLEKLDKRFFDSLTSNYRLINNNLITSYDISDGLARLISFTDLKSIDKSSIKSFKLYSYTILSLILILIIIGFLFIIYKVGYKKIDRLNEILKHKIDEIKIQKQKVQTLLDSQSNIIIITNGDEIVEGNKKLLDFYKDCKTLDEFKEKYRCICTTFEEIDNKDYVIDKDYDGKNWAEYILSQENRPLKVAIYNSLNHLEHFSINVNENVDGFLIVTLSNITYEIDNKKNLEKLVEQKTSQLKELNQNLEIKIKKEIELSKKKDSIIFEQNKMASLSELLTNIAHQWRQPLSVITSAASGMKIQKNLNELDDESFNKCCDVILEKSQNLSNTIDVFSDFINNENELTLANLKIQIEETLRHMKLVLKENTIDVLIDIEESINVKIYKNRFKQALLHILDNSIRALNENCKGQRKLILISYKQNILTIKDNAKGTSQESIKHIFEPYFTTYHQSLGKGLGLYVVKEILLKPMNIKIIASNNKFNFEEIEYKGLKLDIEF